jgi:hypothetical protein
MAIDRHDALDPAPITPRRTVTWRWDVGLGVLLAAAVSFEALFLSHGNIGTAATFGVVWLVTIPVRVAIAAFSRRRRPHRRPPWFLR